jgi:hypothetical protein
VIRRFDLVECAVSEGWRMPKTCHPVRHSENRAFFC